MCGGDGCYDILILVKTESPDICTSYEKESICLVEYHDAVSRRPGLGRSVGYGLLENLSYQQHRGAGEYARGLSAVDADEYRGGHAENMGLPLILQGVWKSSLTSSEVPSSAAGGPSFAKASADKKNSAAPVL